MLTFRHRPLLGGFALLLFLEELLGFLSIVIGFVFIGVAHKTYAKNQLQFKKNFLKDHLNEILDYSVYEPSCSFSNDFDDSHFFTSKARRNILLGLSPNEVSAAKFVPFGNTFSSSDFVKGTIDGVKFISSDVTTRQVNSDNKSRMLLKGRVLIFEFNKPIFGSVFALEKFKPNDKKTYKKSIQKVLILTKSLMFLQIIINSLTIF